jgi:hypothetical protein
MLAWKTVQVADEIQEGWNITFVYTVLIMFGLRHKDTMKFTNFNQIKKIQENLMVFHLYARFLLIGYNL